MDFKNTIISISSEDWTGIYINGELIEEGHSINLYSFLKTVISKNICFGEMKLLNMNDRYEEDFWNMLGYHLPENIQEVIDACDKLNLESGL